jgi:hypothetical protein
MDYTMDSLFTNFVSYVYIRIIWVYLSTVVKLLTAEC